MALSDVLNNLTGARDALVTAINGKGGTVAASATIRQCADAVTTLPEGGGCDFYLCTSVGSGTWTGRKAVLTDGVYVFESAETSGLTYSAVTPVVGNIYSADALVTVSYVYGQMPQQGLKFYASLKNSFVAETGQALNESLCANLDGVVFGNVDGVPCASYSSGNTASAFYNLIDNYTSPLTVSYWGKANGEPDCNVSLRRQETTSFQSIPGTILATIDFDSLTATEADVAELANATTVNNDIVHHYCYTQDGSSVKIFKDGVLLSSANRSLSYNDGRIYLEIGINNGSIGAVRVYNRAISEDEVKILASEFSPVVGGLFFTTTEAGGKAEGGYMFSGTGTLKLQLATGEITELSLTDTEQRAFSAYELSSVHIVSGGENITWVSIGGIGVDYIDLAICKNVEHLHLTSSSSPQIDNLSKCYLLNYLSLLGSGLTSEQIDQILADVLASNSNLNYESFSGSIDVSQNAVPTAAGLETIAQLESVGWSVNYDRE